MRLTVPETGRGYFESLLDSRSKHAHNLSGRVPLTETPFKQFGDWPQDSMITPLVNVQNRRIHQPQPSGIQEAPTVKIVRQQKVRASEAPPIFRKSGHDLAQHRLKCIPPI